MEMPDSVSMTSTGEPFGHQQEKMVLYFTCLTASTRPGYGLTALPFHHSLSASNSKIAKCKCGVRASRSDNVTPSRHSDENHATQSYQAAI